MTRTGPSIDATWALPEKPYVPGRSPRPGDDDDVHRIARAAPSPTDPAAWRGNQAWMAGLRLYANGYFWEAHEVWEAVWANARPNSAERALIQGVIQLANAGLKLAMDRPAAAMRLAAMALAHVDRAALGADRRLMGIDVVELRGAAQLFRHALETNAPVRLPALETL